MSEGLCKRTERLSQEAAAFQSASSHLRDTGTEREVSASDVGRKRKREPVEVNISINSLPHLAVEQSSLRGRRR